MLKMLSYRLKQGVSYVFLCSSVTFYRRNYRNRRKSRVKPTSDEPADLSHTHTQQINLRYANVHGTAAMLTHDPTVV